MDSFTSFYLNKDLADADRNKRETEDQNAESNSVLADNTDSELEKRNGLDSFTSFYLPKGLKTDQNERGKRDILDPFTSFYLTKNVKEANRNKRENQDLLEPEAAR